LAKLIKILVASIGGGLVLGAGIRLGEAIATQLPASGTDSGDRLVKRLADLEDRLVSLEAENPAASVAQNSRERLESDSPHRRESVLQLELDRQAAEVSALRAQLDTGDRQIQALSETSQRLRGELKDWIDESVTARMAEVETRLKSESERGQKQMLDAFAESVQTRVVQRISKLEEEVAGQSAAMGELREYSLRTEQSMQRLLGGLDRLIVKNAPAAEPPPASGPPPAVEPPILEPHPKSSRWKIFS
jgi:chromosome segregation ATPase